MKVILSLSGGLDSTCLLSRLFKQVEVLPVIFSYGSKHNRYENEAAYMVCKYYDLKPLHIELDQVMVEFRSNLLKTGGEIPEGHYSAPSMSQTVVPARNLIFISILAGLAESNDAQKVALAVHAGDHHIYPDCRPEFVKSADKTVSLATDGKVSLMAPFLMMSKGEVLKEGLVERAPVHLTRTCYKDQLIACGKCGSCVERLEAFQQCGMKDPIDYAEDTK